MRADDPDATAFAIARELIEKHGDDVAAFLQAKIDNLVAAGDLCELSAWFIIRNAVAVTITSGTTLQ
jgi:hypothetical protein